MKPGDASSHDAIAEPAIAQAGKVMYPVKEGVRVVKGGVVVVGAFVVPSAFGGGVDIGDWVVVDAGVLAGWRTSPTE